MKIVAIKLIEIVAKYIKWYESVAIKYKYVTKKYIEPVTIKVVKCYSK